MAAVSQNGMHDPAAHPGPLPTQGDNVMNAAELAGCLALVFASVGAMGATAALVWHEITARPCLDVVL